MGKIVKVFASGSEQAALLDEFPVVEKYDGFVLLDVPPAAAKRLAKQHLTEDVTDQYEIGLPASAPAATRGKKRGSKKLQGRTSRANAPDAGWHHYLVQFIGPIKSTWLRGIKKAGGEPRVPRGGFVYVVRANKAAMQAIDKLPFVRWTSYFRHSDRIASNVLGGLGRDSGDVSGGLPRTRVLPGVYTMQFFGEEDVKKAVSKVKKLGVKVLASEPQGKLLIVQTGDGKVVRGKQITGLSAIHGVRRIREETQDRTCNDVATSIMASPATTGASGLKLTGNGEVIGVCDTGLDTGDPNTIHPDFRGRIAWLKSYALPASLDTFLTNPRNDDGAADVDEGHGTHVAGSILGDGAVSATLPGGIPVIHGLATKAKVAFQAVEQRTDWKDPADVRRYGRYGLWGIPDDLKKLFRDAYGKKVRIHSNSWGGGGPGEYDAQCQQLDEFVWTHKDFCILVAAGNDGTDKDRNGKVDPGSVTSPGTAKNCITIGATENLRSNFSSEKYGNWWPSDYPVVPLKTDPIADDPDQLAAFSSRGPTQDGRMKPDVVAPGTFILSTRSTMIAGNNTAWAPFPPSKGYFYMGGTSMATPLAAGAVALAREFLRTKAGFSRPSAALLKAVLIASAKRLANYGPKGAVVDVDQGYGRIFLDAVLAPAMPGRAKFIDVTPGVRTGTVHRMPLVIKSSSAPLKIVMAYSDFPGSALINNLNLIVTAPDGKKYAGNQAIGAAPALDTANNVEVVSVETPTAGSWTVEVVGSNVPHGPQDFALVILAHA